MRGRLGLSERLNGICLHLVLSSKLGVNKSTGSSSDRSDGLSLGEFHSTPNMLAAGFNKWIVLENLPHPL